MDDTVNRLAKELAQAIAAAVQLGPERRGMPGQGTGRRLRAAPVASRRRWVRQPRQVERAGEVAAGRSGQPANLGPQVAALRELTASDRLFLKSLRIAPDEIPEVKS